jgi:hypothetical protein
MIQYAKRRLLSLRYGTSMLASVIYLQATTIRGLSLLIANSLSVSIVRSLLNLLRAYLLCLVPQLLFDLEMVSRST